VKRLKNLFEKHYGEKVNAIETLKGEGSDRLIYRLLSINRSVIGVIGNHMPENAAFIQFSRHFRAHGLKVPEIYVVGANTDVYLEQDLGRYTLFKWMTEIFKENGFCETIIDLYKMVVADLPHFQISAGQSIDFSYCYQHVEFGKESMSWDLQYFKHRFLDVFYKHHIDYHTLEIDFKQLVNFLLEEPRQYFLYRDFQSGNVMIKDGTPHFIDYQSGRRGALQYDLASLLYDAKANIPEKVRQMLLQEYIHNISKLVKINPIRFKHYFYGFVLIRIMQAFGAYGYLSVVKGKRHFLKSVPYAIRNLEILLEKDTILCELKTLTKVFSHLIKDTTLQNL
jgi:aminoglycoside/choline kinase family phosphotransferase